MHKSIAAKYEKYLIPNEMIGYYEEILTQVKPSRDKSLIPLYEVLILIARESSSVGSQKGQGITKSAIEERLNLNRHATTEILGILSGATLIQYDDDIGREKHWTATKRGFQMAAHMKLHYIDANK